MNVAADRAGMEHLVSLGAKSVPVVSRGKDWIFAQQQTTVAKFLGLDIDTEPTLSPQELIDKLNMVMDAGQRFVAQIPPHMLDENFKNRKRLIRDLCYHIFRLTEGFLESAENNVSITRELLNPPAPADVQTNAELVAYGKRVQDRLNAWWADFEHKDGSSMLPTYYGDTKLHHVLERHVWHPGQHIRQLMMLLDEQGIDPNGRVPESAWDGLPIPKKVWDDEPTDGKPVGMGAA